MHALLSPADTLRCFHQQVFFNRSIFDAWKMATTHIHCSLTPWKKPLGISVCPVQRLAFLHPTLTVIQMTAANAVRLPIVNFRYGQSKNLNYLVWAVQTCLKYKQSSEPADPPRRSRLGALRKSVDTRPTSAPPLWCACHALLLKSCLNWAPSLSGRLIVVLHRCFVSVQRIVELVWPVFTMHASARGWFFPLEMQ